MSSLTHQRRYLTASGLNTRWLSTEVCWPCSEQSEVGSTLKREGWGGCILVFQKCSNCPGKTNAFDWRKSLLARGSQCLCCLISFFRKKKTLRVKTFQMQTGETICVNGRRVDCWGGWIWPSVLILPFFAKGSVFGLWWCVFSCCPFNSLHGVYVEEVVHLKWVRNGNKSTGTVQLISSPQCCIFSCQFFSTCWKFLVSCFK